MAQAERDKCDPLKQRLKEIERIVAVGLTAMFTKLIVHDPRHLFKMARQAATSMTIDKATDLWLTTRAKDVKAKSSLRKHKSVVKRIRGWAEVHNIQTVAELTRIRLDEWRGEWGPDAVAPYSKMKGWSLRKTPRRPGGRSNATRAHRVLTA